MKLKNTFALSLLASSIISLTPAGAAGRGPAPDLFDNFGMPQAKDKTLPAKAVKGRNRAVAVHTDLLEMDTLTLNLFDDVVVTAVRDRLIDKVKGSSTWIGHVDGEPESEVFLTIRGQSMSGTVQIGEEIYEIEPKGNNRHDIIQVDPSKNPRDNEDTITVDLPTAGDRTAGPSATDEPVTSAAGTGTIIDLMVVYTPKAKNNASGQTGIEAKIANAVAKANQAYINSKVDMQLNVVYMGEVSYNETGNMTTSLTDLRGTNDGKMDAVHNLRNQYGADQVLLVTADTNYCGIAYVMSNPSTSFAPYAFGVVHDDSTYACLSDNTLAHELGHNQGDQHDKANSSSAGAYDYSYGYRLCQTGGFRTVMSYSCSGGARVSYFSNPNVSLTTGQTTGTATENNALSMNNTKAIVAAFRSTIDSTTPNAPSNLAASALSASEIALTWSDNSSDETGFRLERSADGSNWAEFAVTAGNTTGFTDSSLVTSTTYQYRIRAYNSNGNSSYSNIGSATTNAQVASTCTSNTPALTMGPNALYSKPGATIKFDISLTNQDTSACGISTFTLTGNDNTALGSYALSPASSTSTSWSSPAPSTDGTYTKSVTASATGHASATRSATVTVDGTAPTAPGNLTAVSKKNQVNLSWTASTDSGSGIAHYIIKRNNSPVATTTGTSYTDKLSGRSKGSFTYTVEAVDKVGNIAGSSTSVAVGDAAPGKGK
jgi:peptidyl-Asp metalloendopeptidase